MSNLPNEKQLSSTEENTSAIAKKWVKIGEAAAILGVSQETIRRWDKAGNLSSQRLDGKNRHFDLSELQALKKSQPLTISQASSILGIPSSTLRRLESEGKITAIRNSRGERLFAPDEILKYKTPPTSQTPTTPGYFPFTSNTTTPPATTDHIRHELTPEYNQQKYDNWRKSVDHTTSTTYPSTHTQDTSTQHNAHTSQVNTPPKPESPQHTQTHTTPPKNTNTDPHPTYASPHHIASNTPKTGYTEITQIKSLSSHTTGTPGHPTLRKISYGFAGLIMFLAISSAAISIASQKHMEEIKKAVMGAATSTGAQVLQATTGPIQPILSINIPSQLNSTLTVDSLSYFRDDILVEDANVDAGLGSVFASNLVYSVTGGTGIAVSGDQDLIVSLDSDELVTSLGGESGAITLGSGLTITDQTLTNSDPGSAQNIFKNITAGGNTITAGSNSDTLTFAAGSNISISSNTSDKTITISASGSNSSPWTESGSSIYPVTLSNNVGIGTSTPSQALDVVGNVTLSGTIGLGGVNYTWPASAGTAGYALTTDGSGTLSWTNMGGGGNTIEVQEDGVPITVAASALNYNATDFALSLAGATVTIDIDYATSGITRRAQNETISGNWTYSSTTPIAFSSTTPSISIGNTGTLYITDGTDTLLTITDAGTTGNLSATGNVNAQNNLQTGGTSRITSTGNLTNIGTTQLNGVTYTWPAADGSSQFVLSTNGSGTLSWLSTAGTINYWQRNGAAIAPLSITDDILTGNAATSSALVRLPGTTNQSAFFNLGTGNVGIGNTNPTNGKLEVTGSIYASNGLTIASGAVNLPAGSIDNTELANSTISLGGVTVALGASDATPAFDLQDATNLPIVAGTTGTLTTARGGTGSNLSAATQGSVPYFNASSNMAALAPGTAGFILRTNGAGADPSWVDASTLGTNFWQRNNNALAPLNITDDVLFGGNSTGSAKFSFLNNAAGTPVASISANSGNNATFLTGLGNLATTNMQTLTVGGSTTGNITVTPGNGLGTVNLTSNLSAGTRGDALLSVTQPNNASNDSTSALVSFSNSDTNSWSTNRPVLRLGQVNIGTALLIDNMEGNGIVLGSDNSAGGATPITTGTGIVMNVGVLTSGNGIDFGGVWSGVSAFTGDYIKVSPIRTKSSAGSMTDTGNFLELTRSNEINNISGTYNITGDLARLSSNCTQTSGTCTDTSSILSLAQSFEGATGEVFDISNSGLGIGLNLSSNSGGQAAAIFNKTGANDILTASASGTTKFILTNGGSLVLANSQTIGTLQDTNLLTLNNGNITIDGTTTLNGQTYTWPSDAGSDNYVLTTNGAGVLTWEAGGGGSGTITAVGDVTSGNAFTSGGTQGTSLWFYDADGRGQLTRADLSQARTYTLPDQSGTICLDSGNCTGTSAGIGGSGTQNFIAKFSSQFNITDSSIFDNGNVGIGTTTPQGKLNVTGSRIGQALTILNETGDQNILTGSASGTTQFVFDRTGNLNLASGGEYRISDNSVLSANTLGTGVLTSSLTTVGALASGSIANGFGTIATASTITGTTLNGTTGINTGAGAGTQRITNTGNLTNIGTTQFDTVTYDWPNSDAAVSGYVLSSNGAGNLSWIDVSTAVSNFWQRANGAISPKDITNDLLLGSTATSSALVKLPGLTNQDAFFNLGTGNVGIGITNPTTGKLVVNGSLDLTSGSVYKIDNTSVLSSTTLGGNVVNSSLTQVGALSSGSIASGFGTILTTNTIQGTDITASGTTGFVSTGAGAGLNFQGSGNHDITASGGTLRLGDVTLTGTVLAGNQNITGIGTATFGTGNISISGKNIGLTSDTDLLVLADNTLTLNGALTVTGTTTLNTVTYTWPNAQAGGSNFILVNNGSGTLSWLDPGQLPSQWLRASGAVSPYNITDDVLIGSHATSSALIRFPGLTNQHAFFNLGTGNVGIGTTNPSGAKLDIYDTQFAQIQTTATDPATDVVGFFGSRGDGTDQVRLGASSAHNLVLYTSNSPRITIASTGNVGIGTTTPTNALLDVAGSGYFTGTLGVLGTATNANYGLNGNIGAGQRGINITGNMTTDEASMYGQYNTLTFGTGSNNALIMAGVRNDITLNGNAANLGYGVYNTFTHTPTSQDSYGAYNLFTNNNNSNANSYGVYNDFGADTGTSYTKYGLYNTTAPGSDSVSTFYGVNNNVTETNTSVGLQNTVTATLSSSNSYGVRTSITSSGNSNHNFGVQNTLSVTNNSNSYGIQNLMTGSGNGNLRGLFTTFTTSASGVNAYGMYVDQDSGSSAGTVYGAYVNLTDTDTTRFGFYEAAGVNNYLAGNLGIGTTAPTGKLHVTGAYTGKALAVFNQTGDQNIITASASGSTRLNLDTTGNLAINGVYTGLSGTNTRLQATGNTLGNGNNASIYFLDSTGTTKGRVDTASISADLVVNNGETVTLNTDVRSLSTISAGATTINVSSTYSFNVGDTVLIISADAGDFEEATIASITPTTITFTSGLTNSYANADDPQIIKIPTYRNVTVRSGGTLTAPTWDDNGGVLYIKVSGTMTVDSGGTVTMSGKGFGSALGPGTGTSPSNAGNGGSGTGTGAAGGGGGGSGGAGGGASFASAAGSSVAGGAGAVGGAGGGTGGTAGSLGAAGVTGSTYGCADFSDSSGCLFMGSGGGNGGDGGNGGSGDCTGIGCDGGSGGNGGDGGNGGNGGGIIVIKANTINNAGSIVSLGTDGATGTAGANGGTGSGPSDVAGGGGGGGAGGAGSGGTGGSIWLSAPTVTVGTVTATAGNGVDSNVAGGNGGACLSTSPDGGGGGGNGNSGGTGGTTNCTNAGGNATTSSTFGDSVSGSTGRTKCDDSDGSCTGGTVSPAFGSGETQSTGPTATGNNYGTLFIGAVNTSSADLAEYYFTGDKTIEAGDVVTLSDEIIKDDGDKEIVGQGVLRKAEHPYDRNLIGIISTEPGLVLGSADASSSGQTDKRQLALAGRVPVKVSGENGRIKIGDPLTASSTPGVAMKATEAGFIIARALENWTPGSNSPTIMAFVSNAYYPGTELAEDGTIQFEIDENGKYLTLDGEGNILHRSQAFANIASGMATFGKVEAIEGLFDKLTLNTLSSSGTITGQGIKVGDYTIATDSGKLVIGKNGNNSLTLDSEGASVAGTLTSDTIEAQSGHVSNLTVDTLTVGQLVGLDASSSAIFDLGAGIEVDTADIDFANINADLTVAGTTTLQELTVNTEITVDGDLKLATNSINTTNDVLEIQGTAQQPLEIMNGKITIATDGKVTFKEDVAFEKDVEVKGTFSTKDIKLQNSALHEVSDTVVEASASAGTTSIKNGQTERKVMTGKIQQGALIYITPLSDTQGQTPYVTDQINGESFTVKIKDSVTEDILFNFLIIGTKE